ncbi:MAG: hypothetical protein ACK4N5_03200 [Myxococcales bacterium]
MRFKLALSRAEQDQEKPRVDGRLEQVPVGELPELFARLQDAARESRN